MVEFKVGDRVECRLPDSWVDGRVGVVTALDVTSSDGIRGHVVQVTEGFTVVEPAFLRAEGAE